jgi:hypothetical protein
MVLAPAIDGEGQVFVRHVIVNQTLFHDKEGKNMSERFWLQNHVPHTS